MNLDFEAKFRDIIIKMEKAGNAYAEAKGQSWQLQELASSVKASLIGKMGDVPISRAELVARASEEYQTYIKETAKALTKELKLKAEYEKWKSSFEALRSLSSLEKKILDKIE